MAPAQRCAGVFLFVKSKTKCRKILKQFDEFIFFRTFAA